MSLNEYLYCRNSPTNYTDPDGDYIETGLDIASVVYSAHWLAFDSMMLALPIAPASGVARAGLKAAKGGKRIVREVKPARSMTERTKFLKQVQIKSPKYMKQWTSKGKVPPGYHVHHNVPLFKGGKDNIKNMRLVNVSLHKIKTKLWRRR